MASSPRPPPLACRMALQYHSIRTPTLDNTPLRLLSLLETCGCSWPFLKLVFREMERRKEAAFSGKLDSNAPPEPELIRHQQSMSGPAMMFVELKAREDGAGPYSESELQELSGVWQVSFASWSPADFVHPLSHLRAPVACLPWRATTGPLIYGGRQGLVLQHRGR